MVWTIGSKRTLDCYAPMEKHIMLYFTLDCQILYGFAKIVILVVQYYINHDQYIVLPVKTLLYLFIWVRCLRSSTFETLGIATLIITIATSDDTGILVF